MKYQLTIILAIFSTCCFSQANNFTFPKVPTTGIRTSDFIPLGWEIRDSISGDFNKDSLKDIAIVIATKQPISSNSVSYNPAMVIVLFRQPDKTFQLSVKATMLFGNCNDWCPSFDKLIERRNTLGIAFLTIGSDREMVSYYFRFQNNDWYLIGTELSRTPAAIMTDDEFALYHENINFVTGVKEVYNENLKGNRKGYKKSTFTKKPLLKMVDFDGENLPIPLSL